MSLALWDGGLFWFEHTEGVCDPEESIKTDQLEELNKEWNILWAKDTAQCYRACLACVEPWVGSIPSTKLKKKKQQIGRQRKRERFRIQCQVPKKPSGQGSVLVAPRSTYPPAPYPNHLQFKGLASLSPASHSYINLSISDTPSLGSLSHTSVLAPLSSWFSSLPLWRREPHPPMSQFSLDSSSCLWLSSQTHSKSLPLHSILEQSRLRFHSNSK